MAVLNRAKTAVTRAVRTHNKKCGSMPGKALPDIRALGFLAYRVKPAFAQQFSYFFISGP